MTDDERVIQWLTDPQRFVGCGPLPLMGRAIELARIGAAVKPRMIYHHKKTGILYERLLPMGRIQSSSPLNDMDEVAIYRSQKDGTLWARKASEFDDGRFEPLPTPEQ